MTGRALARDVSPRYNNWAVAYLHENICMEMAAPERRIPWKCPRPLRESRS